jgi:hypothetical protein
MPTWIASGLKPSAMRPGNLRQQRVGQNVIHVARAAFDFRAALGHFLDQRFIVSQGSIL